MTTFVNDGSYNSTTTPEDDSNKTLNLRLDAFDVCMNNIQQATYDLSAVIHTIDFSATGVIFVKTEDMRTTFQFAVDADHLTDVGNSDFDAGIRYYVFDASMSDASKNDLSFSPTWKWDVSASSPDASYIIQPAHAMMDASAVKVGHNSDGMIDFSIPTKFNPDGDDNNLDEDKLVKQDFVRHIAKTVLGGPDLTGLFSNVDQLLLSIENGGIDAWHSIRSNLLAAKNVSPLTNDEQDLVKNPTRALYRQLVDRNPDRFDASGNPNGEKKNKIFNTPNPQPLPFIDGDILEFTFKISSDPVNVPDKNNDISQAEVDTRTYRIKLCLVDGSGNNNEFNMKPPSYVYDFGTSAYGDISASKKEVNRVQAFPQHQRYYEMDVSASTPVVEEDDVEVNLASFRSTDRDDNTTTPGFVAPTSDLDIVEHNADSSILGSLTYTDDQVIEDTNYVQDFQTTFTILNNTFRRSSTTLSLKVYDYNSYGGPGMVHIYGANDRNTLSVTSLNNTVTKTLKSVTIIYNNNGVAAAKDIDVNINNVDVVNQKIRKDSILFHAALALTFVDEDTLNSLVNQIQIGLPAGATECILSFNFDSH